MRPLKLSNRPVLRVLARRDVMPLYAGVRRPFQDRHAGQLSAIVADAHLRRTTSGDQITYFAYHPPALDRRIDHRGQALRALRHRRC